MKQLLFLSFLFGVTAHCIAQTDPLTQSHGARTQGMGSAKVFLPDSWTYFNNIGALDRIENSEISVGFDHRYGMPELSTVDLAFGWKTDFGTLGLGMSRFGGKLFNQQLLGVGFSNTMGIVSIGAKLDWFQTQIEGFGSGHAFLFSLGGIAELGPKFFLGANFSNLNRAKISQNSEQRLPTAIQLGITYLPVESIRILVEMEKDIALDPIAKAGIEYQLRDWIVLRTGISSNPGRLSFGLGLRKDQFGFDYAYGQNSALGRTHHVSLVLKIGER
ncbi:hypothetical protein J0A67_10665 [Algoriphagus aestuariicola]|uniref:PorV/PorQ family protein n=1 Tax=Algoriphagus aestuariicola TaxID=1852016 RepID=A0ABS3BPW1_9BACT|nr:hypothetical protein [Algoriphagus aestuariicola]MBN7801325.1 hypothetical protein [Algoriphagus aestuariicola]